MRKYTLTEYCKLYERTELLREWDWEKNGEITPDTESPFERKRVFWRCEKGHSWQVALNGRVANKSDCPYCTGKIASPGENDFATLYPEIAKEWHPTKNIDVMPDKVRPGSRIKVWWKCEKGHEWKSQIKSRVIGNGCPYCAGKIVVPGKTDLKTLYPELVNEWHPTQNGNLNPEDVRPGTTRKVWWRCEFGHEWKSRISVRTKGAGCPVCAGKIVKSGFNDFKSKFPEIAKQWHPELNGDLKPDEVSAQSNRLAWWVDEFGHEWRATVSARANGSGCPYCANRKLLSGFNDLQTRFPEIAKEWDKEKNEIGPDKVLPNNVKAWWRCPKGHSYEARIGSRAFHDTGCPVCAGKEVVEGENDFATLYPSLAKQWHPTLNGDLKPNMVTAASNKKVWWMDELGHEWKISVVSRTLKRTGCPYCAGRKVLQGFNDLASQAPEIAAQWHPTLNENNTAEMYTCGSNQKIWWKCSEGHAWRAPISRRYYQHSGCPVCSGNVSKKKLQQYERLMKEVEMEKNIKKKQGEEIGLNIGFVSYGTNKNYRAGI